MNTQARDAILIGLFFIAWGILDYLAQGGRLPSLPARPPIIGLDPGKLQLARHRRDTLMRQEGIDTDGE